MFGHIRDAFKVYPDTTAIFNCTGLGALTLGGVEDHKMFYARVCFLVNQVSDNHNVAFLLRDHLPEYLLLRSQAVPWRWMAKYLQANMIDSSGTNRLGRGSREADPKDVLPGASS